MVRVLKSGGVARLVLEDMAPMWSEILEDGAKRIRARIIGDFHSAVIPKPLRQLLAMKALGRWPVQPDHIALCERNLAKWAGNQIKLRRRDWLGGFLTLDFVKA
jgi:hypothetical protein